VNALPAPTETLAIAQDQRGQPQ